ncbi:hypothetical protein FNW52_19735 [Flavobacterium sp. ZT3R18]|uniref:hypothetical protein n=1 Tax=Flavobacterium sp. ZT3R18 TaxID=2594429 RepID=UPI00117ABDCD|nr:hypothetical protein [Flavobacterium sp. ZT3R18]TRX30874.1 hypothetical protein FNW52_19735 [Flavobacterium sp. ZT3R18]
MARILESDNAETLGSLLDGFGVTTAAACGFSGVAIGFEASVFKLKFSLLLLLKLPLIFAFGTSAIE